MKKTILFIDSSISFGGSAVCLLNILKGLDKEKYDYEIICLSKGTHYDFYRKFQSNVVLLSPSLPASFKKNKILFSRFYHFIKLFFIFRRRKNCIVHLNNGIYYPAILAAKASFIPCVCHLRSLPVNYFTQKIGLSFLSRFVGRLVNCFIAVSIAVKNEYLRFGFKDGKILVIGTGLPIEEIKQKAISRDFLKEYPFLFGKFIIGTIGRLSWEKGTNFLVEALPLILKENCNIACFIIGSGPMEREIYNKAQSLNLLEHIHFLGLIEDPYYILSHFDIFILPSLKEGLGLSLMEAMTLGVPVVASRVGGIVELIDHKVNGLLIEPSNPIEIAESVLSLLRDKEFRNKLAKNAESKATLEFPVSFEVKKIDNLYHQYYQDNKNAG